MDPCLVKLLDGSVGENLEDDDKLVDLLTEALKTTLSDSNVMNDRIHFEVEARMGRLCYPSTSERINPPFLNSTLISDRNEVENFKFQFVPGVQEFQINFLRSHLESYLSSYNGKNRVNSSEGSGTRKDGISSRYNESNSEDILSFFRQTPSGPETNFSTADKPSSFNGNRERNAEGFPQNSTKRREQFDGLKQFGTFSLSEFDEDVTCSIVDESTVQEFHEPSSKDSLQFNLTNEHLIRVSYPYDEGVKQRRYSKPSETPSSENVFPMGPAALKLMGSADYTTDMNVPLSCIAKKKLFNFDLSSGRDVVIYEKDDDDKVKAGMSDLRISLSLEIVVDSSQYLRHHDKSVNMSRTKLKRLRKRKSYILNDILRIDTSIVETLSDSSLMFNKRSRPQDVSFEVEVEIEGHRLKEQYLAYVNQQSNCYRDIMKDFLALTRVICGLTNGLRSPFKDNTFRGMTDLREFQIRDDAIDRFLSFVSPVVPILGDYLYRIVSVERSKSAEKINSEDNEISLKRHWNEDDEEEYRKEVEEHKITKEILAPHMNILFEFRNKEVFRKRPHMGSYYQRMRN